MSYFTCTHDSCYCSRTLELAGCYSRSLSLEKLQMLSQSSFSYHKPLWGPSLPLQHALQNTGNTLRAQRVRNLIKHSLNNSIRKSLITLNDTCAQQTSIKPRFNQQKLEHGVCWKRILCKKKDQILGALRLKEQWLLRDRTSDQGRKTKDRD